MFSVRWAAELRFRGRAEGAYCLGFRGEEYLADGTARARQIIGAVKWTF